MSGPMGDIPVQARIEPDAFEPIEADRPRVLLVDDDERNLLAVQSVLEDLGEVVAAHSGEVSFARRVLTCPATGCLANTPRTRESTPRCRSFMLAILRLAPGCESRVFTES